MIVEKLPGTDARLYALVAPLVMSVPIIRQNNNYPFKTSRKHLWFIALERGEVKGFMPVERKTAGACIDNYYLAGDSPFASYTIFTYNFHVFNSENPHARKASTCRT